MAPRFLVIDDFLPGPLLEAIERQARDNRAGLELNDFGGDPKEGFYSARRRLWVRKAGLGPLTEAFEAVVMEHFSALCAGTGVPPFAAAQIEHEVCEQRDGSHFARHIDTDTREPARAATSDRIVSAVFYFPCEPHGFSGGELLLHPFAGSSAPARIAPRRNRLVAFASFAIHEVTAVETRDDRFESARLSINCWLHRDRKAKAETAA